MLGAVQVPLNWRLAVPELRFILEHSGPRLLVAGPGFEEAAAEAAPEGCGVLDAAAPWPGAPMQPLGDPMQDGVGPASYALRAEVPDVTFDEQLPKIVPLRAAEGYYLAAQDPDPRGYQVVTAAGIGLLVRPLSSTH